jgi:hypothetical protein
MSEIKQEFVVPMEATERGSVIVGELKSESAVFPSMLAQFSKIDPSSRKAKIYLYPTLDQAKQLFAMPPPFNFHGSLTRLLTSAKSGPQMASGLNPEVRLAGKTANF